VIEDIRNNKITFGSGALGNSVATRQLLTFLKSQKAIDVKAYLLVESITSLGQLQVETQQISIAFNSNLSKTLAQSRFVTRISCCIFRYPCSHFAPGVFDHQDDLRA
jgi:hypothetical protein